MPSVQDFMVQTFRTISLEGLAAAASEELSQAGAEFLVVTAEEKPLSLLTADQVRSLPPGQEPSKLPVVPVVADADADLDDTVRELVPLLVERADLPGAVVLREGKVLGVLPRDLVAQRASLLLSVRSLGFGLPGNPIVPPPVYVCPNKDYRTTVIFYDRHNPPRCPNDQSLLVREV